MAKKVSRSKLIERRGIALIEQRVSEMEFVWHERQNDFGIDGEVEFRDPKTEAALNAVAFVQSKASDRPFPGETDTTFHYICRPEDIAYWLGGNAPVILICSHPKGGEAWWVSIKDWFSTPERIASRRIDFDKSSQLFDSTSSAALLALAAQPTSGLYFGPAASEQELTSNLLPVRSFPEKIYWTPTNSRDGGEVRQRLHDAGEPASDWIRRDGRVYSFRDLSKAPLEAVCDGPIGNIEAATWAYSDDPAVRRKFVELLWRTLQEQLHRQVCWHPDRRFFYFRPTRDFRPRRISSGRSKRGVTVFREYTTKADPDRIAYYRHHAARLRFVCVAGQWYCEVLPSYHFTSDGRSDSRLESEALTKIKSFERNAAVRANVQLWARFLRSASARASLRAVAFGELVRLPVELDAASAAAPLSEAA